MIQQPTKTATVEDNDAALTDEPSDTVVVIEAQPEAVGLRLDKWLAEALDNPALTRSRLKQLIDEGHVTLDVAPSLPPMPLEK